MAGPLQATIATLGQLGWHPAAPDHWFTADRRLHAELEWSEFANEGILEALEQDLLAATWKASSDHFLGGGLDEGAW